jgi:hypothetical protein
MSHTSWGADASGLGFLVDVASGASSELIVSGLAYAVGRIRGKLSRAADTTPDSDLEMARGSIMRAVAQVFGEHMDALTVTDMSSGGGVIHACVSGPDGTYSARIATLETGDPFVHVTRD